MKSAVYCKNANKKEEQEGNRKEREITFSNIFLIFYESLVHFLESEIRDALKNEVGNFDW